VAGLYPRQIAIIEIRNAIKSLRRWAASLIIAIEFAIQPPTNSRHMNARQRKHTKRIFLKACLVPPVFSTYIQSSSSGSGDSINFYELRLR